MHHCVPLNAAARVHNVRCTATHPPTTLPDAPPHPPKMPQPASASSVAWPPSPQQHHLLHLMTTIPPNAAACKHVIRRMAAHPPITHPSHRTAMVPLNAVAHDCNLCPLATQPPNVAARDGERKGALLSWGVASVCCCRRRGRHCHQWWRSSSTNFGGIGYHAAAPQHANKKNMHSVAV